ncbi:hypothetical protein ACQKCJ_14835 [Flavobacterium sp. NPDC079362]|uniref:hypothetical protein n=1 Tax=Flavobacterium sp. NPDC079362 TaxID=3390566 RepID=UPI003D027820
MQIKSKFRKLFWVRIAIAFLVFIATLYLFLNSISQYSQLRKNPVFIVSSVFLLLFLCAAWDLFKVFKLIVTDQGIEKVLLISGRKQYIPFTSIIGLKKRKITKQGKAGQLTDGYTISILELENNKTLVISPDVFENYNEIILVVKNNVWP